MTVYSWLGAFLRRTCLFAFCSPILRLLAWSRLVNCDILDISRHTCTLVVGCQSIKGHDSWYWLICVAFCLLIYTPCVAHAFV